MGFVAGEIDGPAPMGPLATAFSFICIYPQSSPQPNLQRMRTPDDAHVEERIACHSHLQHLFRCKQQDPD